MSIPVIVFEDVGAVALQLLTTVQPLVVAVLVVVVLSVLVELESSFLAHDPISATVPTIKANQNSDFFIITSFIIDY